MKPKKHTKTPLPLRAWTADDDRAPSSPGPLDDLPPLTAAAVMRAGQGLGWTEVVELARDLERRIQKAIDRIDRGNMALATFATEEEIKRILTSPTRKPAPAKTKPQGANRAQAYARTNAKLRKEKPYAPARANREGYRIEDEQRGTAWTSMPRTKPDPQTPKDITMANRDRRSK